MADELHCLGGMLFASVRTWRGAVKVHIRQYSAPTNAKQTRPIPTPRGVALTLDEFERLMSFREKIYQEYYQQFQNLLAKEFGNQETLSPDNTTPTLDTALSLLEETAADIDNAPDAEPAVKVPLPAKRKAAGVEIPISKVPRS